MPASQSKNKSLVGSIVLGSIIAGLILYANNGKDVGTITQSKAVVWRMAPVPSLSWEHYFAMPFCPYCLQVQNYNPYEPDLYPSVCHACQRRYLWEKTVCPECKGSGRNPEDPKYRCRSCRGDGFVGD